MVRRLLLPACFLSASVVAAQQATPPVQPRLPDMMQRHEQMMAEMKASDARLDELVRAMNAATGDAKISAMAQVINELVRQHQAMHQHMASMNNMAGTTSGKGTTGK
jgi:hypothetical protein